MRIEVRTVHVRCNAGEVQASSCIKQAEVYMSRQDQLLKHKHGFVHIECEADSLVAS